MNKRRQAADLTSSATSAPPGAPGTTAQPFVGPAPTPHPHGGGGGGQPEAMRRSMSVPGPIGGGTPIPGATSAVTSGAKVAMLAAVDGVAAARQEAARTVPGSQSVDSFAAYGKQDQAAQANKSAGFMSKIFGKSKDNTADTHGKYV